MSLRACLIVDNPLRDLDGIIMVAWQLARRGMTSYLVPMYDQAFDIAAAGPDIVVANYVRPNNRDLLVEYRNRGARIAILDTEGAGGKSAEQLAEMTGRMDCRSFVDLYCVWGEDQFAAFQRAGVVPPGALRLTGCPRYDFCAAPWIDALPTPSLAPGYVLVNTNFPTVNARFSRGRGEEVHAMLRAGYSEAFAQRFIRDAAAAHEALKAAISGLARKFASACFVIRPHPFERIDAYADLRHPGNVLLRQEGTSLQWLHGANFLIHQNCSTAIESVMLGRPCVSLNWFNTETLYLEGPTSVSFSAGGQRELEALTEQFLSGSAPAPLNAQLSAQERIIRGLYYRNDGRAAERVADALLETAATPPSAPKTRARRSARGFLAAAARRALGYRGFSGLQKALRGGSMMERRKGKNFRADDVQIVLERLSRASGDAEVALARPFSGASIAIEPGSKAEQQSLVG